jgi:hypothetical protein
MTTHEEPARELELLRKLKDPGERRARIWQAVVELPDDARQTYIFSDGVPYLAGGTRWGWLETCLLGDIRTFLDGVEHCYPNRQELRQRDRDPRGAGNPSLPILVCTAIDILSDLWVGETDYLKRGDEGSRAQRFIAEYFLGFSREIPQLMWDGIRNGLTHLYVPGGFEYEGEHIGFGFESEALGPSSFERSGNQSIFIKVNVFELYEALKHALFRYRDELVSTDDLQRKFVTAWVSIEVYGLARRIGKDAPLRGEVEGLRSRLEVSKCVSLFA